MLQPIADFIVNKIQFATKVDMIMFASISVAVVLLLLLLWYIIESTREEIVIESPNYQEEDFSSFQKLLDERKERESASGTASKYTWTQNEEDVDIYIPIQDYPSRVILKSDIKIDIKASHITVSIAGEIIIDDEFCASVRVDECNWQIEDMEGSARRLWISVCKRIATTKQNYWKYILLSDENTETSADIGATLDRSMQGTTKFGKVRSKML